MMVPAIVGTSESGACGIISNGFGRVGTTDDGFFGSGIYFSNSLRYASSYAHTKPKLGKVFLISLVTIGNSFPVTEQPFLKEEGEERENPNGFVNKPCRRGYQSHFSVVYSSGFGKGRPFEGDNLGDDKQDILAHEYVAFEASQCLPLFLIFYKDRARLSQS